MSFFSMFNKKKARIILISTACFLAVAVLVGVIYTNHFVDTYYSTVPEELVGSYEDFVDSGEHIPAETMTVGVNVNGLEGDFSRPLAKDYITDIKTYMNIKKQGFDHIRLPVNFNYYYSADKKELIDKRMKTVDKIIDLAEKTGLYVQLDFHGWWEFDVTDSGQRETFLTIWDLVAKRYSDRSELLIFELINEPPIKTVSAEDLNQLQKDAIALIRKSNPTRLILCAAADGNQPWILNELWLPAYDNLAVAVHIYSPADFTHQGFVWAGREAGKQVRLTDEMMAELEWNLNETQKFIQNKGYKVYLNEFGLNLNLAHPDDRSKFLRRITQWCKENDVAWTFWGYNNQDMALFHDEAWKAEVLDDLFLR